MDRRSLLKSFAALSVFSVVGAPAYATGGQVYVWFVDKNGEFIPGSGFHVPWNDSQVVNHDPGVEFGPEIANRIAGAKAWVPDWGVIDIDVNFGSAAPDWAYLTRLAPSETLTVDLDFQFSTI